jgi:hypothetical protein
MRAVISGIGYLIDFIALMFIVIRLYRPTKESKNFSPTSFRGSLFWMYISFALFLLLMSFVLISDDKQWIGLYGYTLGHVFLYISLAIYVFAPFSIIAAEKKWIPKLFSLLLLSSGAVITYINWTAYASGDYVPEVGENQVIIWNPPDIVFFYIIASVMLVWGVFGAGLFFYHAFQTKNASLTRRSRLLGLGFLILVFSGPPHDVIGIPSFVVLIADIAVALGIFAQGYALSIKIEN